MHAFFRSWMALLVWTVGVGVGAAPHASADETAAAVQALQARILNDPSLARQVHSLIDDPQVREILADPAIAAALERGDFAPLLADPKIRRLADHPAMQSLTRDVVPPK